MNIRPILIIVINLALTQMLWSQTQEDTKNYIQRYSKVAMDEMQLYKIPASITLAQGILESASGKSRLAIKANNHFGIKCSSNWDGEKIYHDDDNKGECFRSYTSAWGSFRDHSKFLSQQKRYKFLFDLDIKDYKEWAKGLKQAGYATDKSYPTRLIDIIERFQLYQYDQMVLDGVEINEQEIISLIGPHDIKKHPNRLDYIIARDGDTYSGIELELGIKAEKIIQYNDKNWDSPIAEGEILFIERKRSYGATPYYTVKSGDNMHTIAQNQGIRLEYLYKRNNMEFGDQPSDGTVLFLRKYKK